MPQHEVPGPVHMGLFGAQAVVQVTHPLLDGGEQTRRLQRNERLAGFVGSVSTVPMHRMRGQVLVRIAVYADAADLVEQQTVLLNSKTLVCPSR